MTADIIPDTTCSICGAPVDGQLGHMQWAINFPSPPRIGRVHLACVPAAGMRAWLDSKVHTS